MNSAVCTLFEGNYHYGVGALINSLLRYRFSGDIWVGYRGNLPPWAHPTQDNGRWREFALNEKNVVRFIKLKTDWHFTNYKPCFMLDLWNKYCPESNALIYLDPDIVVKCRWEFYETWVSHGVALVHEIVSNNMPPDHPIRREWEKVIVKCNKRITRELFSYINGGFCGVTKPNKCFLENWLEITNFAVKHHKPDPTNFMSFDRTHPFYSIDQDALNIAAMCCDQPLSTIGPEGMDFIPGGFTMSHAVGSPKPWRKNYLLSALKGIKPSMPDKAFWDNAAEPIPVFPAWVVNWRRAMMNVASLIGRFYHR